MNVLVTGAAGLVGGWLLKALVERGRSVVCLIRDEVPGSLLFRLGLAPKVTMVRGDLGCRDDVARTLNEHDVLDVFHLGAQAIVGIANRDPISTFESNVRGTWNVLEACRRHGGIRMIVVASSDKCYGDLETLPYTEEMPLRGANPYDASKAAADIISQSYISTYKMPVAIARCGNIYGGGDVNWSRIVPGTIRSLLRRERPVIRSDGTPRRDYLHVDDAVSAYLALGDSRISGAFNFGTETPTRALDVVQALIEASGLELQPIIEGRAQNEIAEQWLSSAKAAACLGWRPSVPLKRGLKETLAWYEENGPWA